jgi:hypothetical protein
MRGSGVARDRDGLGEPILKDDENMEEEIVFGSGGYPDGQPAYGPEAAWLHFKGGKLHGSTAYPNPNTAPGATGDPYNETLVVTNLQQQIQSCGQKCAEQDRLAREHCNVIRQRVAAWMKDSGCPSSVRGFKKRAKASCAKKKSSSKKKGSRVKP